MGQPSDSEADFVQLLQPSDRADHARQNVCSEFCRKPGVLNEIKPGKRIKCGMFPHLYAGLFIREIL